MIKIERTTAKGYESKEFELKDAILEINNELDNKRTVWIDGKLFQEKFITENDLEKVKKEITITNKLTGG